MIQKQGRLWMGRPGRGRTWKMRPRGGGGRGGRGGGGGRKRVKLRRGGKGEEMRKENSGLARVGDEQEPDGG